MASNRERNPSQDGLEKTVTLLLQQGNHDGAVASFRKEETQWPESKAFMDRMIQVASNNADAKSPTKGP